MSSSPLHFKQVTLQGRMLRVLLAALALVAVVLLVMNYAAFKTSVSEREALRSATAALGEALSGADEAVAGAIVQATELQFNRSRQAAGLPGIEDLLFQLQAPDGRVVFASAALNGAPAFSAEQARSADIQVQGRSYWPWLQDTSQWRVVLLEPVVRDSLLLRWLGGGLLQAVLVAVPILLLPLWWAVRTGLAPLRRLVSTLGGRDAADLSPLQLDLRYAELQPIVGAIDGLLDRARRQVAHERALMHNAAHELRTPLAVVAAQAHALSVAPDKAAADVAQQGVQRGVQRASHVVEQLLALARLETPAGHETAERMDLVVVCRQHLIDLTPLADARGIEMALVSPDQCLVTVAANAVHSIIDNLLRNALNHCPPGSNVEVRLAQEGLSVRLDVLDDGPGMLPEERQRAFDRFFRGRGAGPGSGLGLAIVQQAARQLGGGVSLAAAENGRGLHVAVTWPAKPAKPE